MGNRLTEYLANESARKTAGSGNVRRPQSTRNDIPREMLEELIADMPPQRPAQGPSLLQLAKDPRRREECPVCAAEWSRAVDQSGQPSEVPSAPSRRRVLPGKGKMH